MIAEAPDHLLGVGDREKVLLHRDDLTEAERTELVSLEDACEEERQRNYQASRQKRLAVG
jgi:hypothetical protein